MKSTLKYGIITGVIVGAFAISFFSIVNGLNNSYAWGFHADHIRGIGGLLTIVILATGIYITMQAVKRENGNKLTYKQALKTGITVAICCAIITASFGFTYCEFINPGYQQYMVAEAHKELVANGATQPQILDGEKKALMEYSTTMQVVQALVGQFMVGTVVSLIMGLFVKTKK